MSELFATSARVPTDVNQSLALLRPRGSNIGPHSDGWGAAFYKGRAARIFEEPVSAAESACLIVTATQGAIFYPPAGWLARVMAPIDPWLGRRTTIGAAFIAMAASRPQRH